MVSEQPANSREDRPVSAEGATVLLVPFGDRLRLYLAGPVIGLLLALALPPLSRWLIDLRIVLPVRPVFRLLAAIDRPWEIALTVAVAVLIGAAVALVRMTTSTRIGLTDDTVRLATDDWQQAIARPEVSAVFPDQGRIVILDQESRQLAGEPTRVPVAALSEAFRARGYPWHDADPYLDLYHRWEPGAAGLPPEVNAVLEARRSALKRKARQEARDLRDALQRLGFAVRDDGSRQYWRPLVRS
jgi:hypothetical protein